MNKRAPGTSTHDNSESPGARTLGLLSVVVPCYNETAAIVTTATELLSVLREHFAGHFELIFVDDGSHDGTQVLLADLRARHDEVGVVTFSRNFGHQIAVSAGVEHATGDAVVLIDADLQDPPRLIVDMVREWEAGADVVYGQRIARHGESAFKRATAAMFYRALSRLSDIRIPIDTGDFRLMDQRVCRVLRSMPERDRFLRGMVAWAGFRQIALRYKRDPRHAGETKYPVAKMIAFAVDGITAFSTRPLRVAMYLGLLCACVAILGMGYAVAVRVFTSTWVPGWAALFVAVLFVGGAQLFALGVVGEYVGRLYVQTKQRPLYVVANSSLPRQREASSLRPGP